MPDYFIYVTVFFVAVFGCLYMGQKYIMAKLEAWKKKIIQHFKH